ncbi:vesicle transport through interaction with t-SNAREs homolog 1A-like [Xenia sp. Carnegie-2017]|uniref:vesicle transport through interaction with t-SNAREs homolog 1A-like n=1 Tax=Xenia sp. Carnegie-2017 TaxID=2897299 RepID=UPI001F03CC90|nr:vesicle transport through interaction with t-SNAREs homolog 1A-like [Xenia sp. Carnegie-2017]
MGDLFGSYEHTFGTLTAEITSKIGRIPSLESGSKKNEVKNVEKLFDEVKELLEQMDLEAREQPAPDKTKLCNRVKTYEKEVQKLEQELKKAQVKFGDYEADRNELLNSDFTSSSEDQRTRLLNNTERLERSSNQLDDGYRMCIETEEMGTVIMDNLQRDREVMMRTRERLRNTDQNLGKSSRILTGMMRRIVQNKIIMAVICLIIIGAISFVIYMAVH